MGQDDLSGVDAQSQVHEVRNVCIADVSIMPMIPTGNSQAPRLIVGERMAEILRS